MLPRVRTNRLLAASLLVVAGAACGQVAPPTGTLSLTDEQKAELLRHDTEDSVAGARSGLGGGDHPGRQIHGEVGAFVGTHGARGAYGTAAVPLGDNAAAAFSFESSRYGRPR